MKITWLGHACFKIESNGSSVVIDPYDHNKLPGYPKLEAEADRVLVTHEHDDHNFRQAVTLTGKKCELQVSELACFHDDQQGAMLGPNTIFIIEDGQFRLAHFGDLGHPLNEEQLAVIEQLRHLEGVGVCIYDVKGGFYDGPEEGWQAFLQTWDKDHMFRSRKPAGKYLYGCDLWLRDSAAGQAVSSLCQTREIGSHLVRVLFAGVSEEETLQRTAEYLKMNSDKVVII